MEDNKTKGTIYQQLNSLFTNNNFNSASNDSFSKEISGVNNKKIIIKGNNPNDVVRKGLELQQRQDLENKFFRNSDRSFQKSLQYEAARLPAYMDYEGMEFYPIISAALDLFMEEATTIGYNGKMLNIYSKKDRIKKALEELFYDTINVNVNLPFWIRNLTKYGDNFILLYGERKKGITHAKQMVNYEIERYDKIKDGKPSVIFKDRMTGDEFNSFEVAHFRLLGDDKYLPYGSSILNKVRRVFRQLIMAEDAMLTYRIIRAGEKKVFKIDIGNIDEDDVEEYIHKVATKFKRTGQVSPNDGQIDYRFNMLGNDEDYFLPVRNANTLTGIDTLPGAQNLNDILDIEYLRDNLFIGLGVPKPFLSFQDAAGAGKNMAQYDIRFAKKVIRIQQAAIQELNKMAIIHLFLLGFTNEDLNDFELTLTNPSIQQELLKSELLREKAQTYTELTRGENGIAAMSHTEAKRVVFNYSDSQIVEDLKQQKMEKVVMQELADAPVLIKKSGLFADIDKKFGQETALIGEPSGSTENGGIPPMGNDMGGIPPMGNDMGGMPPMGGQAPGGTPPPPTGGQAPPMGGELPPMNEDISRYMNNVNRLVYGDNYQLENVTEKSNQEMILESMNANNTLNDNAKNMIKEIDELLDTDKDEFEGIDFENLNVN